MLIEAFTEAKNPGAPDTNEDALFILPGRAYAVIDGVSDRTGQRYDGMLAGRFAARLVRHTLERIFADTPDMPDPGAVVATLTAAIAAAYAHFGTLEQVRTHWGGRLASTIALVMQDATEFRAILIGDSGLRVNGGAPLRLDKDLDRITATLRRHTWHLAATRTDDQELRERLARRVAWMGAGQEPRELAPTLTEADLAAISAQTIAACTAALPHVPPVEIAALVRHGIVNGQGKYQNSTQTILGYSCLDGFAVPPSLMRMHRWPAGEIRSIELFTDGYFREGDGFGVASWEEAFRQVERDDPHKLGDFLSPRGSIGGNWADDRSYLGVRP